VDKGRLLRRVLGQYPCRKRAIWRCPISRTKNLKNNFTACVVFLKKGEIVFYDYYG
jgi:hypothetical protein